MSEAMDKMIRARTQLLFGTNASYQFFSNLSLRLELVEKEKLGSIMATDGKSILFDPNEVNKIKGKQVQAVIVHEILHCVLDHFSRKNKRKDHEKWNYACDLAINPMVQEAGFVLPENVLLPGNKPFEDLPRGKSSEQYYEMIKDMKLDIKPSCGVVMISDSDETTETSQSWESAIKSVEANLGKGIGNLPGPLQDIVSRFVKPQVDWKSVLEEFVRSKSRNDYSWSYPNRRFISQGLYLPNIQSEDLGNVGVALDESGSISDDDQAQFLSELKSILASYNCKCYVLHHDVQVAKEEIFDSQDVDLLQPKRYAMGGTSHIDVFKRFDEIHSESDGGLSCTVCLTDLGTSYPQYLPDYPTLWVAPKDNWFKPQDPPFGQVTKIGNENENN